MPDMGGLRKAMPVTFATMTVWPRLAGGPAAVRRLLLQGSCARGRRGIGAPRRSVASWAALARAGVGLVTVAVTAAYVTRLWLMTFFDTARTAVAVHESPPAMRGR
jgi:NADH-quinone oxidoreductase subunit L